METSTRGERSTGKRALKRSWRGGEDAENMKTDISRRIAALRAEFPFMVNEPATPEEILKAEKELQLTFSREYKELLAITSGAMLGPFPFFGTRANELMDTSLSTVVSVTRFYRMGKWPIPADAFVFSQDHAGNAIYCDGSGTVRKYDHDVGSKSVVSPNVVAFAMMCMADT